MNDTDEALVRRAQQRDRAAFEELVRRTGRLVFSRLFLDAASADQAEDLTQETFLIAWKRIGQLTDASGFRPWLLTLARNAAIDAARRASRKKRWNLPSSLDAAQSVWGHEAGPAVQAEQAEDQARAMALLGALPEEYRLPLILRYIGGADYDTISRQLGLTNGSLRGVLNRGLAKLRSQMKAPS